MGGAPYVQLSGRSVNYQRILVNQSVAASGSVVAIINCGLGTKAINAVFRSTGIGQLQLVGADNSGTYANGSIVSTASAGQTSGTVVLSDFGGAPYFGLIFVDKSAAANTIQFVDVWWTKG
jgi:hypothetical protein